MQTRNDYRPTPPPAYYGQPGVSYPTPNLNDLVIVEEIAAKADTYKPLPIGTPHPKKPLARLIAQEPVKSNGKDIALRLIYATPREAQDAYNASLSYTSDSKDYPSFIRSYIIPRLDYTRATDLEPLKTLIGIKLTSGGSGYAKNTTVSISGTGSGATAECLVIGGVIVAVWLTNGGNGYTSAPTVSFSGGSGSGATATALIQPQTALLVKEEAAPAEGELSSLFLRVTRIYQTLPGPWLTQWVHDERTGLAFKVERRYVAASAVTAPDNSLPTSSSDSRVVTEYQPESANVYVQIKSTFPSESQLEAKVETFQVTDGHSFPNLLENAEFVTIGVSSGGNVAFDTALRLEITQGYSGPVNGILTEYYTYKPESKIAALESDKWQITQFWPKADTIYSGIISTGSSPSARIVTFVVPETLRDAMDIDNSDSSMDSDPVWTSMLPASSPTLSEFREMEYIVKSITVEKWRGDIYIVRLLKIKNPHFVGGA